MSSFCNTLLVCGLMYIYLSIHTIQDYIIHHTALRICIWYICADICIAVCLLYLDFRNEELYCVLYLCSICIVCCMVFYGTLYCICIILVLYLCLYFYPTWALGYLYHICIVVVAVFLSRPGHWAPPQVILFVMCAVFVQNDV